MPGGDRTGPMGQGPITGRGAGLCAGNQVPDYAGGGRGRGFSGASNWNCRGGSGWRNRFYATGAPLYGRGFLGTPYGGVNEYSAEAELRMLKEQADFIDEKIKTLESAVAAQKV